MPKPKIMTVVGARPQFVKLAMVSRYLRRDMDEIIVHTGQHYDYRMSRIFFRELDIPRPDYNLGIGSGTQGYQVGRMLEGIEGLIKKIKPSAVMVFGDTNSTLAAGLAAAKLCVSILHVEAGMRSYNRKMPEEINRVLTDHLSDVLFCSSRTGVRNLRKEGITRNVYNTGDVMVDAALKYSRIADRNSAYIKKFGLTKKSYLLLTIHRQVNADSRIHLEMILDALKACGEKTVFPVHPRTARNMKEFGIETSSADSNIIFIPPQGYINFITLLKNARMVLTDSGGVQKEAYVFGVPCVTLRDETEWIETVKSGWNILVGANFLRIIRAIRHFKPQGKRERIFGDGRAGLKIAGMTSRFLEIK